MHRLILPGSGVGALALAVLASAAIPVQQPAPAVAPPDDRARVSVVCPNLTGTANPTAIAAGSVQANLSTAELATPSQLTDQPGNLVVKDSVAGPLLVAAPRQDTFSATTRTTSGAGSDRGLSMMSCSRPSVSQWFAGVTSSGRGIAELVLLNADSSDAVVDIAVHGAQGRLAAPGSRGIIVPARSRRAVPLGPLFTAEQAVALHVTTSAGRVAAAVRQQLVDGGAPAGSDWLPPTTDPANLIVIPGLPAGAGSRDLVLVNPGERTASVALQVLGTAGPTGVPGFETIDLPAGTTRTVPLGAALAGAPAGLRLVSEQPVTAAVVSGHGAQPAGVDLSTQVATGALNGPAVLAVSPGSAVAPVLHLTGVSAEPTQARVRVSSTAGAVLLDTVVTVPGLADATLTLPAERAGLILIDPVTPGTLHASLTVTVDLDGAAGVASLAVLAGDATTTLPPIRSDPRVGS